MRSRARHFGLPAIVLLMTTVIGTLGGGSAEPGAAQATRIPAPSPAGVYASGLPQPWASRNWSGYAVTGSTYTSVTGSWNVPTVTATKHSRKARYSSTWVGIDGFKKGDDDLIQAGTEQDWFGGTAQYQAWWEILPADETPITSINVHPGDLMTVSITQAVTDWTIVVTDTTTDQSFTTTQTYHGPLSSAEWIEEAPEVGRRIAALANYGIVDFESATVNGGNPGFVDSDSGVMEKANGVVISTPSAPDSDQDGFAVAFGNDAPPPPSV